MNTFEDKKVKLKENGVFETGVDIIVSMSSIQSGQYIKESILSTFVQTYINTTFSIRQFQGRNRNKNHPTTQLYVALIY